MKKEYLLLTALLLISLAILVVVGYCVATGRPAGPHNANQHSRLK